MSKDRSLGGQLRLMGQLLSFRKPFSLRWLSATSHNNKKYPRAQEEAAETVAQTPQCLLPPPARAEPGSWSLRRPSPQRTLFSDKEGLRAGNAMPGANGRSWNLSEQSKVAGREGPQAQAERRSRAGEQGGAGPADVCCQEVKALRACEQVLESMPQLPRVSRHRAPACPGDPAEGGGKVLKTTLSKQWPPPCPTAGTLLTTLFRAPGPSGPSAGAREPAALTWTCCGSPWRFPGCWRVRLRGGRKLSS